jgi:hypothetical protein
VNDCVQLFSLSGTGEVIVNRRKSLFIRRRLPNNLAHSPAGRKLLADYGKPKMGNVADTAYGHFW